MLPCITLGNPKPDITWLKDDELIQVLLEPLQNCCYTTAILQLYYSYTSAILHVCFCYTIAILQLYYRYTAAILQLYYSHTSQVSTAVDLGWSWC